jgi:carboxymethylenebutenolidase
VVAYDIKVWNAVAPALNDPELSALAGCVVYLHADEESSLVDTAVPTLRHVAGNAMPNASGATTGTPLETCKANKRFSYPKATTGSFAIPFQPSFSSSTEAVSHTRSLSFLKPLMNSPYFDLETIWAEHTYYEFADRSCEHTMSTMVQEPYVNHVPTV